MQFGAKLTTAVRELIFIHSQWDYEKDQLIDEKDRAERFYFLSDFQEKLKLYRGGNKTTVRCESGAVVVSNLRKQGIITTDYLLVALPQRTLISYSIRQDQN